MASRSWRCPGRGLFGDLSCRRTLSPSRQPIKDTASSSVAKSGAASSELRRSGSIFSEMHACSALDTSDKNASESVMLRGESTSSAGAGVGAGVEPEHAGNSARRKKAAQYRSFNMEASPSLRSGNLWPGGALQPISISGCPFEADARQVSGSGARRRINRNCSQARKGLTRSR